jgi:hypothetical protein
VVTDEYSREEIRAEWINVAALECYGDSDPFGQIVEFRLFF